jgi:hypothetical protein
MKISDDIQNFLKIYFRYNIILFVEYNSGFENPNFNFLLEWINNRKKNILYYHYLLIRNGNNLRYNSLIILKYGWNYENLIPYLNKLFNDPADPSARKTTSAENNSDM